VANNLSLISLRYARQFLGLAAQTPMICRDDCVTTAVPHKLSLSWRYLRGDVSYVCQRIVMNLLEIRQAGHALT